MEWRGKHEALFLPVLVGCSRSGYRSILVASVLGQMGDHRRGRDPGYHEPLLSDVLLPELEKGITRGRKTPGPKNPPSEFFFHKGEICLVL